MTIREGFPEEEMLQQALKEHSSSAVGKEKEVILGNGSHTDKARRCPNAWYVL